MALGSTQPLTEMSTRNVLGGKERPVLEAVTHTAVCEPIVSFDVSQPCWPPRFVTGIASKVISL
jgi:hypothetical protein